MSREKGTKGNPFFCLKLSFEDGVVTVDAYPVLDEERNLGPKFVLETICPNITGASLDHTRLLYARLVPPFLKVTRSEIIRLAAEVEATGLRGLNVNAYMLFQPVIDMRLALSEEESKQRFGGDRYVTIPVAFYEIEVKVPEEIRRHAAILQQLGI